MAQVVLHVCRKASAVVKTKKLLLMDRTAKDVVLTHCLDVVRITLMKLVAPIWRNADVNSHPSAAVRITKLLPEVQTKKDVAASTQPMVAAWIM